MNSHVLLRASVLDYLWFLSFVWGGCYLIELINFHNFCIILGLLSRNRQRRRSRQPRTQTSQRGLQVLSLCSCMLMLLLSFPFLVFFSHYNVHYFVLLCSLLLSSRFYLVLSSYDYSWLQGRLQEAIQGEASWQQISSCCEFLFLIFYYLVISFVSVFYI